MSDDPTAPDAPPRLPLRDWHGLVTLSLALFACMLSALALTVSLGGSPPQVTTAAHAARPPWPTPQADARPGHDAARHLVAIEVLLLHQPHAAPFPRAFAVAVALATGDAEATRLLLPLAAAAAEGAPTAHDLAQGFEAAWAAAALAEAGFAPDAGWVARRVAGTLRLGAGIGAAGTSGLAALRQAARHLEAGELIAAEAALRPLAPATAAAIAPWRAGLLRRIAADAAFARLSDLAGARAQAAMR